MLIGICNPDLQVLDFKSQKSLIAT